MSNNLINSPHPLLIPELFQYVLENLILSLPQRPSKEERRMLAVLARTCRAFSEPSLNCLWRRLNSLLPLIRCFSDVADEARVHTPPSAIDWISINRYAPRIRELTLGDELLSIQFFKRTGLVLPNLKVFRWNFPPPFVQPQSLPLDTLALLWPLIIPNISTLEILFGIIDDPYYRSFLETCTLPPNLRSIKFDSIGGVQDTTVVSSAISHAICGNPEWQHVALAAPIDNVVLDRLAMSSTLKTVSLTLAPQTLRPDGTSFEAEVIPFRNVSNLALTLYNPLDFATCLLRPREQMFRTFEVTIHTISVATEVFALLTALASPPRIYSVQSIDISHITSMFDYSESTLDSQLLSHETFRPLVSFMHLRRLAINLDHLASLNDEEFGGLVRNWPLLEVIGMKWALGGDAAASVTLKGLLMLITSCRKLREIGLTLDAREVPVGSEADICNHSLASPIVLHNSPLKHPDLVAQFFKRHLPAVPGVVPSFTRNGLTGINPADVHINPSECQRLWTEVDKRIRGLPLDIPSAVLKFSVFRVLKKFLVAGVVDATGCVAPA